VERLALPYARTKHPCRALAKRLLRHQDELFQFVLVAGLAADTNLAERSLQPLVVIRKISGGSRSGLGSQTRLALATLFGTWQARGLDPLAECLNSFPQTHRCKSEQLLLQYLTLSSKARPETLIAPRRPLEPLLQPKTSTWPHKKPLSAETSSPTLEAFQHPPGQAH
jgi:hypothetical protein